MYKTVSLPLCVSVHTMVFSWPIFHIEGVTPKAQKFSSFSSQFDPLPGPYFTVFRAQNPQKFRDVGDFVAFFEFDDVNPVFILRRWRLRLPVIQSMTRNEIRVTIFADFGRFPRCFYERVNEKKKIFSATEYNGEKKCRSSVEKHSKIVWQNRK